MIYSSKEKTMKRNAFLAAILMAGAILIYSPFVSSQEPEADSPPSIALSIETAVMCETIENYLPKHISVVFSVSSGKVICYTAFDHVPEETVVYHDWYRKDQLSTKRKLVLKPPKWAVVSEIQLRETDRGPWRVEVTDEGGNVLATLRFSITE